MGVVHATELPRWTVIPHVPVEAHGRVGENAFLGLWLGDLRRRLVEHIGVTHLVVRATAATNGKMIYIYIYINIYIKRLYYAMKLKLLKFWYYKKSYVRPIVRATAATNGKMIKKKKHYKAALLCDKNMKNFVLLKKRVMFTNCTYNRSTGVIPEIYYYIAIRLEIYSKVK